MVSVPSYYANVAGILGDGAENLLTVVAKILLVGLEYFTVGAKISWWLCQETDGGCQVTSWR